MFGSIFESNPDVIIVVNNDSSRGMASKGKVRIYAKRNVAIQFAINIRHEIGVGATNKIARRKSDQAR